MHATIKRHGFIHTDFYLTPDTMGRYLEMNYAYWAAICFVLCEYIATSSFEFKRIWGRPITAVKLIYLWSRYFSIIVPFIGYATLKISMTHLPISPKTCSSWFTFQAVGFYLLYQPFSAISMLRVYAMYNRQKQVGALLSSLWLTEVLLSIFATIRVLTLMEYDGICYGTIAPGALWLMGGVVLFTQMVTLIMTTAKRSAGRNAVDFLIAKTVLRDGLWMFALVVAIVSSAVPYQFAKQELRPHWALAWPSCLIAFTTCRLIMNMQNIKVDDVEDDPSLKYIGRSLGSIELPPFLADENQICIHA